MAKKLIMMTRFKEITYSGSFIYYYHGSFC